MKDREVAIAPAATAIDIVTTTTTTTIRPLIVRGGILLAQRPQETA